MIKLYNTRSHTIEEFIPLDKKKIRVKIYSCGPTVYDYQHIGHMRRYVGDDLLIRVLSYNGYLVKHAMNITDVGHLTSDADSGEDKMEKGSKKFNKSVWEIAKMFEKQFVDSCKQLHIRLPKELLHATDYITQQITLIQILERRGFTYSTQDGIYFNTAKFPDYFKLSRQNPNELKAGARVEMLGEKKNISDFALWKFSPKNEKRQMEWKSPWGIGFPGWHIECSAMSMSALGESLDIHTGGIDHINIHHTNEIAQSEAATGHQFVRYWVHHNFLVVNGEKMSKSLGNFITVQDVIKKGYDPLALRYLYFQTHYRQEMNFTWGALDASQNALNNLRNHVQGKKEGTANILWIHRFIEALNDDLGTAKGLAIVWELTKEHMEEYEKTATLLEMDKIMGFGLEQRTIVLIPEYIKELVQQREHARKLGDYGIADNLRKKIHDLGYDINDKEEKSEIIPIRKKKLI